MAEIRCLYLLLTGIKILTNCLIGVYFNCSDDIEEEKLNRRIINGHGQSGSRVYIVGCGNVGPFNARSNIQVCRWSHLRYIRSGTDCYGDQREIIL